MCPGEKRKLLLHACCAPDATVAIERLAGEFEVALFFENSNIDSPEEFEKRLSDLRTVSHELGAAVVDAPYSPGEWEEAVRGLEREPEGGKRCAECFRFRLMRTARAAEDNSFEFFATTLTVSPHKDAALINGTGEEFAASFGVTYLPSDFKKKDGFKRSVEISRRMNLYRQDYCGCKYSKRG